MSVLANRMADRGLREAAAGLLAAGVDAELDGDEWTGALTLLSRLAILDPDAAEVRLKRFEEEDPVTGGSAVSAIIGHLLRRSDNDTLPGAQRWIRRLPHHDGQIGEDEALLLRFGGNCPDLTADLERISRRVINDCHEHLRVLSSPKSREREEIQSRWAHVAEALVLLGGFRRASERVRTAWAKLRNESLQIIHSSEGDELIFLEPFSDPPFEIALGEAADFYIQLVVREDSFADSSLSGLGRYFRLAVALWRHQPSQAQELAANGFAEGRN